VILYIAENRVLAGQRYCSAEIHIKKGTWFIRTANGDVVTWCIGHLLEQAEPDAYNPDFKNGAESIYL
jgi:DNA topoisomerase-3